MGWNNTCLEAKEAKDATCRIFKPGDKVAYLHYGDIHTGIVHKINLNDDNEILTCWITPDEKFKWDARRHEVTIKYGKLIEKELIYWGGSYKYKEREFSKTIKTPYYNDALISIEKIIKI